MVIVAQLVRAPDCGSGGRRFEPDLSPHLNADAETSAFFFASLYNESLFLQWLSLNCGSFQTVALFKL